MTRVVIDPGVLVSAFISPGGAAPARVVEALLDGRIVAITSPQLLDELARVLARDKFARYSAHGRAEAFVAAIIVCSSLVDDPPPSAGLTEDPGDDYLVSLANSQQVDAIVSGDRHLQAAKTGALPVWSPREFVDRLDIPDGAERYVVQTARAMVALQTTASLEHLVLVLVRSIGEGIAIHVRPDGQPWWGVTHEGDTLMELRSLVSSVRAEDEEDITSVARSFDPGQRREAPMDELFGSYLLGSAESVSADYGLLMARDAVERTWLAWRFEEQRLIGVEETPAFFDEQLKRLDAFTSEAVDRSNVPKPPLRLAAVGDPRVIEMSPEMTEALDEMRVMFREKFGRDPGPGDPLFFDVDADEPRPMPEERMDELWALMEEFGFGEDYRQRRETELLAAGKIQKIGRNDPCPCGSGKKFKRCHGS